MSRVADYLSIPADYVECLEGLRWSEAGDAVETASGNTFAVNQEIALFLEGFASQRPLLHFGHILHFLHLLKRGGAFATLRHAYESTHRSPRNAGAFCARLCNEVPAPADPPQVMEIWHSLMSSCYVAALSGAVPVDSPDSNVEMPPLGPLSFEEQILRALRVYTDDELHYWFAHGQGPVQEAGASIAQAVADLRPRSLAGVLASLAQRQRLAGAVPFVAPLAGALTLPPRRLSQQELPMGGYADVTTRGHPEQVLPSQLVLDDLEFVRRFAANELLYFRREEPHARLREELVILIDQGVRTWGVVRLVLCAAFFAFGKLAQRRKLSFQVATTGTVGRLTDPLQADDATLGTLIEASDLSPHPGLALEGVLEGPTTAVRDVVLLTHPRSLRETDVRAAARRVSKGTRLVAVTVDDHGSAELSELRRGTPVSLTCFRVDLTKSAPEPKQPKPVEQDSPVTPSSPWQGDVEQIGYPFRFGLPSQVLDDLFDFDGSGDRLLVACTRGMLYAMRTDGSANEMLPRGIYQNQILTSPDAVLGVTGGFAVCGRLNNQLVVFHYETAARRCTAQSLGPSLSKHWTWYSIPRARCIVVRSGESVHGLDLGTTEYFSTECKDFAEEPGSRVEMACLSALERDFPPPKLHAMNWTDTIPKDFAQPGVCLHPSTGELKMHHIGWRDFRPETDGRPTLKGAYLFKAVARNNTLALLCRMDQPTETLRLFVYNRPGGTLLLELPLPRRNMHFTLSHDGCRLARTTANGRVEVRNVIEAGSPLITTPRGRFHNHVATIITRHTLFVAVGKHRHLISWSGDRIEHRQISEFIDAREPSVAPKRPGVGSPIVVTPELQRMLEILRPDPRRFIGIQEGPVIVLVDCFGQIALLDSTWNLICMMFVFRSVVAAWMPDGTRYGPAWLTGGPETPGAAEKIARRLQDAWFSGEEVLRTTGGLA